MAFPPGPHLRVHVISDRIGVYAVTSDGNERATHLLNEMVGKRYQGDHIAAAKNGARCYVALVSLPGGDQPANDLRDAALPLFTPALGEAREALLAATGAFTALDLIARDAPEVRRALPGLDASASKVRLALAVLDRLLGEGE